MKLPFLLVFMSLTTSPLTLLASETNMVSTQRKHCTPCEGGIAPLTAQEITEFMDTFSDWKLIQTRPIKIKRAFVFKDFTAAMAFVNNIATIADEEGHHPDIYIFYNKVTVQFYTHAIDGLSANDFIMAGLVDDIIYEQNYQKHSTTK